MLLEGFCSGCGSHNTVFKHNGGYSCQACSQSGVRLLPARVYTSEYMFRQQFPVPFAAICGFIKRTPRVTGTTAFYFHSSDPDAHAGGWLFVVQQRGSLYVYGRTRRLITTAERRIALSTVMAQQPPLTLDEMKSIMGFDEG